MTEAQANPFPRRQHGTYRLDPYLFEVSREKYFMFPGLADLQGERWVITVVRDGKTVKEVTEQVSASNPETEEVRIRRFINNVWAKLPA